MNMSEITAELLVAVDRLDDPWYKFSVKDDSVFDNLLELGLSSEYSSELVVEVTELIISIKVVANRCRERTFETSSRPIHNNSQHECAKFQFGVDGSQNNFMRIQDEGPSVPMRNECYNPTTSTLAVRLPETPLPSFNGNIYKWLAFSFYDQLLAMVHQRPICQILIKYITCWVV